MSFRHLLGLEGVSREEITLILDTARPMKQVITREIKKVPPLRGRTVATVFYEPSTRTRASFELAAKYLSADTVSISAGSSSVTKGESLADTARTIQAMGADAVVLRHPMSGAASYLSRFVKAAVINAGDGMHEHPSQALLDMFTIREAKGSLDGLRVAVVGDILHSRVARSNIWGLTTMGASVFVSGPPTMLPPGLERMGATVCVDLDECLDGADVVMVLRLQTERQRQGLLPSLREYAALWGVNRDRLALAKPDALLLHPGPMNRGVEITSEVADGPQSVIREQVTNGVAVRMAVLYLLLLGEGAVA
ncbi:MAG: aspartate carbamoyltransferase catalytic subunit [Thermoanaerobacterales bacterium]|nr:aspartate carbamoyltransferase catalytic subunit [Thermoanaerobacterales bacterium]